MPLAYKGNNMNEQGQTKVLPVEAQLALEAKLADLGDTSGILVMTIPQHLMASITGEEMEHLVNLISNAAGHQVALVALPEGMRLEALDESQMLAMGWMRVPSLQLAVDADPA